MVRGRVEDILQRTQAGHQLGVDPELGKVRCGQESGAPGTIGSAPCGPPRVGEARRGPWAGRMAGEGEGSRSRRDTYPRPKCLECRLSEGRGQVVVLRAVVDLVGRPQNIHFCWEVV